MGLIKINMDNLPAAQAPQDRAFKDLERFSADMAADRSHFFHLPEKSQWAGEIQSLQPVLAKRIPEFDTFLHLGIGGSSLGPETLVRALGSPKAPTFHFLDNIDPDALTATLDSCDPETTLAYVVTKSGGTFETLAAFMVVYQWMEKKLGKDRARNHLVFCTDPEKGDLKKLADNWGIPTFHIPPNLGGRFSVLSGVGLFPAMVAGIDSGALLKGAADYRKHVLGELAEGRVPAAVELAYRLTDGYLQDKRPITVLMPYSQRLKTFSAWFTQLWAESLGKDGKGFTPVPALGATDQHSILQLLRDGPQDKIVGFLEVAGFDKVQDLKWTGPDLPSLNGISGVTMNQLMDAELNATREVLTNAKKPHFTIEVSRLNANTLGQLLFMTQLTTAMAGYALGVDPFDQPGVEEGKKLTRERIAACKKSHAP